MILYRLRLPIALAASLILHATLLYLLSRAPAQAPSSSASIAVIVQLGEPGTARVQTLSGRAMAPRGSPPRDATRPAATPAPSAPVASAGPQDSGAREDAADALAVGTSPVSLASADRSGGTQESPVNGAVDGGEAFAGGGRADAAGDSAAELAARLSSAIEARKTYPEAARRRGAEGLVRLRLRVSDEGLLVSAKLAESSGSALLDRAALDLASSVFPIDNTAHRGLELLLAVSYALRAPAAPRP